MPDELIVAHSSDLHIGGRWHGGGELHTLRAVLEASSATGAQVLVLAGDVFDSHRTPARVVAEAGELLRSIAFPVVILPGNHDPATADAVYHHGVFAELEHVRVLGVNAPDRLVLDALELEISGVPHTAYADMAPIVADGARRARWRVVVAHGHWVTGPNDAHRGWQIHDETLALLDADYVALGHWDLAQQAGDGRVAAYYSGSPELSRTLNIVRLSDGSVDVRREPLRLDA